MKSGRRLCHNEILRLGAISFLVVPLEEIPPHLLDDDDPPLELDNNDAEKIYQTDLPPEEQDEYDAKRLQKCVD